MATLQKFKLLATQCAVAASPTRSPVNIHLRRRKTLRMLLSRGGGGGDRDGGGNDRPLSPGDDDASSPDRNSGDGDSPEKGKEFVGSHKLKDLFVSSPPSENSRPEFSPPGIDGSAVRGIGVRSVRPLTATLRQRLLRRAWRPMLVSIPE